MQSFKRFFLMMLVFQAAVLCASKTEIIADAEVMRKCCFGIRVVDEQTGRGVPLIELKTTNHLSYVTDSHGLAAFYEPGLMGKEVFFHVSGHGYTAAKDGFGYRGKRLRTEPGGSAEIRVRRINVAERLYRVTGQGIYRDSVLVGDPAPLDNPVINALVMGQDSVQTCWYRDKLYWLWGDTGRVSYPLGHFATAGAVSYLPEQGGLNPAKGVDLHYITDENGFSKKMAPLAEPGVVWLDGLFSVDDTAGKEHLLAVYARMKTLGEMSERGLMHYQNEQEQFVPIIRSDPDFLPYRAAGHPLGIRLGGERYCYFATPFPLSVRMRVKASWKTAANPGQFEVYTSLTGPDRPGKSFTETCRWVSAGNLVTMWEGDRQALTEALQNEKSAASNLRDIESGEAVRPHGGSVHWNDYRRKWIMITVQEGGDSSYLGEVWYAEADTPTGPWGYARKIVTHDSYSFYNPKQHPYFDQEGGRLVYFEGTYSHTFSGDPETATPRYDYNQIMYRLDLADERLCLPVAVYAVDSDSQGMQYVWGEQVRSEREAGAAGPAFFAIPPERAYEGLEAVYRQSTPDGVTLSAEKLTKGGADPFFYGVPVGNKDQEQADFIVPLYECRHKESGMKRYTVQELDDQMWRRRQTPICYVWESPAGFTPADWDAKPWRRWR